jgi:4-alpha-glucanotransferase
MKDKRKCGVLLHPTSLPSKFGIGDMGKEAYQFIDFLKESSQKLWQILPINPMGYGGTPYQSFSAFAGNPLLICMDKLVQEGLLSKEDVLDIPPLDVNNVEFEKVKKFKEKLLRKSYIKFREKSKSERYYTFIERNSGWLEDYSLFMVLKQYFDGMPWNKWEKSIAFREKNAVAFYRNLLIEEIEYHKFLQYQFQVQWLELKQYANTMGIKIIGDLPIFVSYDSSDAWAKPELFQLDEKGNPKKVAGVPPDYFSKTGQLWGNPHYQWDVMEKDNFKWWTERFVNLLSLVDVIRVDHFRGFEAYWEIPAGEKTAVKGKWVKAPGEKLFTVLKQQLGELPVIAEDLGYITSEVIELKNKFRFPGMKILQFAYGDIQEERFSPEHFQENCVLYTGTHDNDTTVGWYKNTVKKDLELLKWVQEYFDIEEGLPLNDVCWHLIEAVYKSNADTVIIPLQDILCLDSDARMNIPGTKTGNWAWRYPSGSLTKEIKEKLKNLASKYSR